jgi:hypothetical protein
VVASDEGAVESDEEPSADGSDAASSPAALPEEVMSDPDPADAALGGGTVRSLWQYLHLIASSWISSAQYGHFFTIGLHGPLGVPAYRRWPGRFVARLA